MEGPSVYLYCLVLLSLALQGLGQTGSCSPSFQYVPGPSGREGAPGRAGPPGPPGRDGSPATFSFSDYAALRRELLADVLVHMRDSCDRNRPYPTSGPGPYPTGGPGPYPTGGPGPYPTPFPPGFGFNSSIVEYFQRYFHDVISTIRDSLFDDLYQRLKYALLCELNGTYCFSSPTPSGSMTMPTRTMNVTQTMNVTMTMNVTRTMNVTQTMTVTTTPEPMPSSSEDPTGSSTEDPTGGSTESENESRSPPPTESP